MGDIPEALAYLQMSTERAGAMRWIAPEQIDPEASGTRTTKTDVYSFGCVALHVGQGHTTAGQVRFDFLAGIVWQTTVVGSPARFFGHVILV